MLQWNKVLNASRNTVNKKFLDKEPTKRFKRKILMSEHSPIRLLNIDYIFKIKSWVSVHLVRHKHGIEHFVSTQRDDRTGKPRESQNSLVSHYIEANAQAIINISRKRLCTQSHPETRKAWKEFLESFKDTEPELYNLCVPECVYRNGLCPEINSCNWNKTPAFKKRLDEYLGKDYQKQNYYYDKGIIY